jgi:hypothetical protein
MQCGRHPTNILSLSRGLTFPTLLTLLLIKKQSNFTPDKDTCMWFVVKIVKLNKYCVYDRWQHCYACIAGIGQFAQDSPTHNKREFSTDTGWQKVMLP